MEIYPCKIEIYETYNPGAVVRILACDASGTDVDHGRVRYLNLIVTFNVLNIMLVP